MEPRTHHRSSPDGFSIRLPKRGQGLPFQEDARHVPRRVPSQVDRQLHERQVGHREHRRAGRRIGGGSNGAPAGLTYLTSPLLLYTSQTSMRGGV